MGGRGSASYRSGGGGATASTQQQAQPTANQQSTPILQASTGMDALAQMDDSQLAALAMQARNQQLPNQLNDAASLTQRFVFAAGLNEKPTVLDDTEFSQFMTDNNMTSRDLLSRSVSPISYTNASGTNVRMAGDDVADMLKYSRYNYIGGKHGGNAYGDGTYFDHVRGRNTGYGSTTVTSVLNPATAKVISDAQLRAQAPRFAQTHPKFAAAVGRLNTTYGSPNNNMSIYALAMGYNVIDATGNLSGYTNVIDRAALVYRASNS